MFCEQHILKAKHFLDIFLTDSSQKVLVLPLRRHAGAANNAKTSHFSRIIASVASRSAGEPCTVQRKILAAADFQNFLARPTRVDQEKKEVRKRRASIYRGSPSDAVDYFLVLHVITGIVVIGFVISKNRRLGAFSTTLNGHLLVTAAWSSSLSSTSSSRNVKTAASFCRCTRNAGACLHGSSSEINFGLSHRSPLSLSFIRLVRLLLLLVLELQRWPGVRSSGSLHRSRGRLPCIIMEEQEAVVSLLKSVRPQCIFSGGRRQSLGKSVVMRTLRKEQSCRWWWENFCRNVLPLPLDWLADLPSSSFAKCSRTTKPLNRLGLGRRGYC